MAGRRARSAVRRAAWSIALCALASPVAARAGESKKKDAPTARVTMRQGRETTLSAPLSFQGKLSSPAFELTRLDLTRVASVARVKQALKQAVLAITFREPDVTLTFVPSDDAKLTGSGEWGKESIALGRVASMTLTHTAPAKPFQPERRWSCTLAGGKPLPIGWSSDWRYRQAMAGKVGELSVGLKRDAVRTITIRAGKGDVLFTDGSRLTGWAPEGSKMRVATAFGEVDLNWGALDALTNEAAKPTKPATAGEDRIVTVGGAEVALRGLKLSAIQGALSDVSLELDAATTREIARAGEGFALTLVDGKRVEGFQPAERSRLSGSSDAATVSLEWKCLKQFTRGVKGGAAKPEAGDPFAFRPTWSLKTKRGVALPLSNLEVWKSSRPDSVALRSLQGAKVAKVNGELQVKKLNWGLVRSASVAPAGLKLTLTNQAAWALTGALTAACPYGKVEFACKDVAALTRAAPPPSARPTGPAVVGRLVARSGNVYHAAEPTLAGGSRAIDDKDYWGHELFVLRRPPVELWIGSKPLLSYRLRAEGRGLVSEHPLVRDFGPLTGFGAVAFQNIAGEFVAPIEQLTSYEPQAAPGKAKGTEKPTFRIRAIGRTARSAPFHATRIQFIRYPKYGWTGSYTKWAYPFQWHRGSALLFKRADDGSRLDVEFGNLRRIQLEGRYTSGRKATLTSTKGGELKGAIYPGDVAKSHGVSTWNPSKEGLACRIADSLYVFIRFSDVTAVEIGRPGEKEDAQPDEQKTQPPGATPRSAAPAPGVQPITGGPIPQAPSPYEPPDIPLNKNRLTVVNGTKALAFVKVREKHSKLTVCVLKLAPGGSQTVPMPNGEFYDIARFGEKPGSYRYAKGEGFKVDAPAGKRIKAKLTLHPVPEGKYRTHSCSAAEFE